MPMNLNGKKKPKDKIPGIFLKEYNAIEKLIDRENFREFILPDEN